MKPLLFDRYKHINDIDASENEIFTTIFVVCEEHPREYMKGFLDRINKAGLDYEASSFDATVKFNAVRWVFVNKHSNPHRYKGWARDQSYYITIEELYHDE